MGCPGGGHQADPGPADQIQRPGYLGVSQRMLLVGREVRKAQSEWRYFPGSVLIELLLILWQSAGPVLGEHGAGVKSSSRRQIARRAKFHPIPESTFVPP